MVQKAIRLPSGDQHGASANVPAGLSAILVRCVPSAFITYRSVFISLGTVEPATKAMRLPSGDHAGSISRASPLVSTVCSDPSGFMVQMLSFFSPARLETNRSLVGL